MKKFMMLVSSLLTIAIASPVEAQPKMGQGIDGLDLSLYADVEARGSGAGDVCDFLNPAALPNCAFHVSPEQIRRLIGLSGGEFFLNIGGIGANVTSGTATAAFYPFVFSVNVADASGSGSINSLPGASLKVSDYTLLRFTFAADLAAIGLDHWSVGVITGVPVREATIDVSLPAYNNLVVGHTTETRPVDLTLGVQYRRDWYILGAYTNFVRTNDRTMQLDPTTGDMIIARGSSHLNNSRVGASLKPGVLANVSDSTQFADSLRKLTLGVDVATYSHTVFLEGTKNYARAFFGIDVPVVSTRFVEFWLIGGVDSAGGYGVGPGIYGVGPLSWLSFNLAYSDRPLTPELGAHTKVLGATGSIFIPF